MVRKCAGSAAEGAPAPVLCAIYKTWAPQGRSRLRAVALRLGFAAVRDTFCASQGRRGPSEVRLTLRRAHPRAIYKTLAPQGRSRLRAVALRHGFAAVCSTFGFVGPIRVLFTRLWPLKGALACARWPSGTDSLLCAALSATRVALPGWPERPRPAGDQNRSIVNRRFNRKSV